MYVTLSLTLCLQLASSDGIAEATFTLTSESEKGIREAGFKTFKKPTRKKEKKTLKLFSI